MTEQATILASRLPEHHNKLLAAYLYIYLYTYKRGISRASTRPVFGCWLFAEAGIAARGWRPDWRGPQPQARTREGRKAKRPLVARTDFASLQAGSRWGLSFPPPAPAANPASTDAGSPETGKVSGRRDGESSRPTDREGRSKPAGVETRHEARCEAREPGRCAAASRPNFTAAELDDAGQPHRHRTKAA